MRPTALTEITLISYGPMAHVPHIKLTRTDTARYHSRKGERGMKKKRFRGRPFIRDCPHSSLMALSMWDLQSCIICSLTLSGLGQKENPNLNPSYEMRFNQCSQKRAYGTVLTPPQKRKKKKKNKDNDSQKHAASFSPNKKRKPVIAFLWEWKQIVDGIQSRGYYIFLY